MSDEKKKNLLLRIPQDLWADLNVWARDELRSVNAQIEYVLREAVRRRFGGGKRSQGDWAGGAGEVGVGPAEKPTPGAQGDGAATEQGAMDGAEDEKGDAAGSESESP